MLKLVALVLPLSLDTFAVSAALTLGGLSPQERLRVAIAFPLFEAAMPLVGLLIGDAVGEAIGGAGDAVAGAALVALGLCVLFVEDEPDAGRVARARGLALLGLGFAISLDELAIGFSVGLLQLSIVAAVALIGVQAIAASQAGLRLGARLGETAREWAERLAGLALGAIGMVLLAGALF